MADSFVLTFDVDGDTQVMRGFSRFGEHVKDLSAAFREIAQDFHKGEAQQFQSAGGYGAGGWTPLAPSTIERKQRSGYPLDILVRTGELRESLSGRGKGSIETIQPLEMHLGTSSHSAVFHQRGTSRMPARPVIMLPEEQKTRWHKIIHKFLVQAVKESF